MGRGRPARPDDPAAWAGGTGRTAAAHSRDESPINALLALVLIVVVGGGALALVAALGRTGSASGLPGRASPVPTVANRPSPSPAPVPSGPIVIGVSLAMLDEDASVDDPILEAVKLAVEDANERALLPGRRIEVRLLDHAVGTSWDPGRGRDDMEAFARDPSVVGVVGPYYDAVAALQIPVAYDAGLLQCSPSNVTSSLTLGEPGSWLQADASRRTYLRVQAPEARAGAGLATFAWWDLEARTAALVTDGSRAGLDQAETFRAEWARLGGTIAFDAAVTPRVTWAEVEPIADEEVDVVVYTGTDLAIPARLRPWLDMGRRPNVPLLGGPELVRHPDDGGETWLERVLAAHGQAGETYVAEGIRLDYPGEADFDERFERETGVDAGWYGAAAYVCAEAILHAVDVAEAEGTLTREAIRAVATDPDTIVDSVWGAVRFDEHGDIVPSTFTIWHLALDDDDEREWDWEAQVGAPLP